MDKQQEHGQYRKKPIVIEAWRIDMDSPMPRWVVLAFQVATIDWCPAGEGLYINTMEGHMRGNMGDWLIQGVAGELYPCKPDIFAATYEPVSPTAITAEEAGREGEAKDAWISVNDRVPAVGQEVLVFGQSPWEKAPSIKVDLWDEIHEAPVSFSSATVSVGEGWTENDSDDITHWRELPSAPAQSGGQG